MASLCKKQQCTIDKRGFRQELDSWRHKLIHCVGFESILEGLIGPELIEDLKVFKDFEPVVGSDWSFKENCLFCCLRRDKVKEHLIGLKKEVLDDTAKPLLVKDQITIIRLEKQAEEFLSAVLCRKDAPNFSDPHIPVVAREILQRMISQFAAEYTSKTSSPQDSRSDSPPHSDQSLPASLSLSGTPPSIPAASLAGPAHNQNPVLSKLLMADQDAPLDLTIKKPLAEPTEQDGVLDLSIKKNRYSSTSQPGHNSSFSPTTSTVKSESPDFHVVRSKDLQSTSTLEQFMAKLCSHHQRQIVDAIGFLQMEVKAHASSNTQKASNSAAGIQGIACSNENSSKAASEKSLPELKLSGESAHEADVQELSYSVPNSCSLKTIPENAVSLKTSVLAGPVLDIFSLGSDNNQPLATPIANSVDGENNRPNDHAPLRLKIMTSNVAAGKKLSCVLDAAFSSHSEAVESKEGITNSASRAESHGARLSTSVKRHNQMSFTHQARLREVLETPARVFPVHTTIPSDSARTARKTIRTLSEHQIRDSVCREVVDPDLGHCDIVFIDKPITECYKEKRRSMLPRRNARKSTRGHMYSDEVWELKTVRTLAGRGNCPNPMPELITLVTPRQILSKPEGVPPVDMPFAGACTETMNQQMPTEETGESLIPGGDVVQVAASKADVVVEMSQTDPCQNKAQSSPSSPLNIPAGDKETSVDAYADQDITANSGMTTQSAEGVDQPPHEATKDIEPQPEKVIDDNTELSVPETEVESLESTALEEADPQLSSDKLLSGEPVPQQNSISSAVNQVEEEMEEDKGEKMQDAQNQEFQSDTQTNHDNLEVTENVTTQCSADEPVVRQAEMETSEVVDSSTPVETENNEDEVTATKALDAPPKELPPSRRKKRAKIQQNEPMRQTETVIVGYVNGKPVSASDRSLRHRAGKSPISPGKSLVKSSQDGPNETVPNTTIDFQVENTNLEKPPAETHMPLKLVETPPAIQQEREQASDPPSSPAPKLPPKVKQIHLQRSGLRNSLPVFSDHPADQAQSITSKRLLRSTSQKPSITPALTPTSKLVTSISSPELSTLILPPAAQLPPLLLPYPLPIITPLLNSTSESSVPQLTTASETVVSNTENTQPTEASAEETQKMEVEVRGFETKQKLRSAKVVEDSSENEKEHLNSQESDPLHKLSPIKTEIQTESEPIRSRRVPRKNADSVDVALTQKKNIDPEEKPDQSLGGDDNTAFISEKPTRMPLRSETSKAETSQQSVTHSPPANNKKLALRSQRSTPPSATTPPKTSKQNNVASPVRIKPERISKAQMKTHSTSVTSFSQNAGFRLAPPKQEPPKQTTNKFLETLTGEGSQHLITNLNNKYDKMLKGWVQMDKEAQPATKYKNKSDRQAAIWKSKRRARKSKSSEQQKYSPVQLLFMKGFDLTSICRWFLESTETKSLVIVKKVNTRLPSETQLCFHSSSTASGSSQGVFPSLQAERLKKHLKKFAIASPVKSNPKSLKLIAKALEQEANAAKGKERAELPSNIQTPSKSPSSAKACAQKDESPKSSGNKNPASARILRKYSNIREKLQVQQTTVGLKRAPKMLKSKKLKTLAAKKSAKSNLKPSLRGRKPSVLISKRMKETAAKLGRRKMFVGKKSTKYSLKKRTGKSQGCNASRNTSRKEPPKRSSQRLGSPKTSEHNSVDASKSKVNGKKQNDADSKKCEVNKLNHAKTPTKEPSQSSAGETKGCENAAEIPQQLVEVKASASPDQVLTRSQRKMEAAAPSSASPSTASKRATKSTSSHATSSKVDEPKLTRSGTLKRFEKSSLPRSGTKRATKRAQEPLETPAKRTRTK